MITLDDLEFDMTPQPVIVTWGSHVAPAVSVAPAKAHKTHKKSKTHRWKEVMMFGAVMGASAIAGIVFTNLHLFQATIMEDLLGMRELAPTVVAATDGGIIDADTEIIESTTSNHFYLDTKDHLKNQLASNALIFNTLPPDNRVIIDDLWVDTPIVDLAYYTPEKLEKGDFKLELERGVIRYPNTGTPSDGNMLIFGHTSDYWWNNNEFGQIFRNIPKLEEGQIIKIIWNNQMYQYKIIKKEIVKPKHVSKTYAKYHDDDKQYLTLVGCYPVGTADSRIVVVAELLPNDGSVPTQPSNEVVQLARNP